MQRGFSGSTDPSGSIIKDPSLAPDGHLKIDWAAQHSPVLTKVFEEDLSDGSLEGRSVAMTIHLEAKTAYLTTLLAEAGAEVTVTGSNPLSTQDDVCAALVERRVRVFATHDPSEEEFEGYILKAIETGPEIMIDDGAELVSRMVESYPHLLPGVVGATEETTTGILKLAAMDVEDVLPFPVLAANNARCKHLFDNRYGTGQSSLLSVMANTNLFISGKAVVVMGFGWVSRGLAKYAKGLGARVIVCESDPVKLLEAYAEGYEIMNSLDAAEIGEIFLTGTGNIRVLRQEHFERMRDGALLANAGHYDHEIDARWLAENAKAEREVRQNVTEYELASGKRLHLLAKGRLVNSAAGDAHPVEIMDLTFGVQTLALHRLASAPEHFASGTQTIPAEIDERVARLKLDSLGVTPEEYTAEQVAYQTSWR
jgi:adenosylhomocysteinase